MQIVEYTTVFTRITDAFDVVISKEDIPNQDAKRNFDNMVNSYIEAGWQPLGAPWLIHDNRWQQINQTMVKYLESVFPDEPHVTGHVVAR